MIRNVFKILKRHVILIPVYFLAIVMLAGSVTVNVHAAPSWVRAGEADVYGSSGISSGTIVDDGEEEEKDSIIKHADKFLLYIEDDVNKLRDDNSTANLTMDSIVFGRLAGYDISIGKFELYNGNPYGIIGAYGYRLLRNVIYGMMFIYFLVLMLQQLTGGGAKKRAELKDVAYNLIFIFFMLSFMPVLINMFTILRDELIIMLANVFGVSNFSGMQDIFVAIQGNDDTRTMATTMLTIGYSVASIFFMGSYISNSLLATGFFILFPVIMLRSMKNKTIFSAWCGNMASYLVFPAIDFVFLSVPLLMKALLRDTEFVASFTYMVITVLCVWAVIPTRNGLMRFVGNSIGIAPSNGAGALMGMAMMAMRGMGGSRGGLSSGGGGERGGFFSDLANANKYDALAANMDAGMKEATMQMNGIGGLSDLMEGEKAAELRISSILSDGNEDSLAQGASAALTATDTDEVQDALTATAGGVDELVGDGPVSNMEMDTSMGDVTEESMSASPELEAGFSTEFAANVDGDTPTTADGTPLTEDSFAMGDELVMPDTNIQREQLENARLENLDRMDKAQSFMDYQDTQIAKYNSAIGEQVEQGAKYKSTMDTLTESTSQRAEKITSLEQDISKDTARLTKEAPGTADYARLQNNIATNKMELEQLNDKQETEEAQLKVATENYSPYQKRIASLEKEIATAKEKKTSAGIIKEQRSQKEKEFANIERMYGGSGEEFTNKAQYSESVRNHEIEKRHMSYRNFDSKANLSILSPQEKAEFYRERAYANAAKKIVTTGYGVAGGFLGASAGLYGGAQSTMIGLAGGTMVGKGLASKTISTGEDIADAYTSGKDKEAVDSHFNKEPSKRGERVFKSGGTKYYSRPTTTPTSQTNQSGSSSKPVIQRASENLPEFINKGSAPTTKDLSGKRAHRKIRDDLNE